MIEQELFEERAAIMEYDAGLDRKAAEKAAREDVRKQLHDCEVSSVVKMYKEQGGWAVREYLLLVEKHRGKEAHDRLRIDSLKVIKP